MKAFLLDPSINSHNLGDLIIKESVLENVPTQLGVSTFLPTQTPMRGDQHAIARAHDIAIVGGTNLLSSNMPWYRQWKLDLRSRKALRKKAVLMGVGWWQYQHEPNTYTTWMLQSVLSDYWLHSVRDEYTKTKLTALGIQAVNTACPTMWGLTRIKPASENPDTCVVTLTDYNRNIGEDQWLLNEAAKNYKQVVVWPQSIKDASYADHLYGGFRVLEPTLSAFNKILESGPIDYIGTRLHGGVRAFQKGQWGMIIAVDNRAVEIGRDTNLPVFKRGDRAGIRDAISEHRTVDINLPKEQIDAWLAQFEPDGKSGKLHDVHEVAD